MHFLSAAEVYSWQDGEGNTHFGDKPPSADAKPIQIKPTSGSDASNRNRYERTKKLVDSLAEERQERKQMRAKEHQARQERLQQCEAAKNELKQIREAQFLYRKDEDGEKTILSFEERAQAERKAREEIRKSCGEN